MPVRLPAGERREAGAAMLDGEELAELAMLEAYRQYGEDPWLFVAECCRTKDEADGGKVKNMPDKEYLRYVTRVWKEESLLAIPKSRRMLLTWLFLCLHFVGGVDEAERGGIYPV